MSNLTKLFSENKSRQPPPIPLMKKPRTSLAVAATATGIGSRLKVDYNAKPWELKNGKTIIIIDFSSK